MNKNSTILWTIAVLCLTTASCLSIQKEGTATGALRLSEEQLRTLTSGKANALLVKKTGEHQYDALNSAIDDIIIKPPVDCWDLFDKFMEENKLTFQKLANQRCVDFIGCWCCPGGGVCITFIVKPNSIRCTLLAAVAVKANLAVVEVQ